MDYLKNHMKIVGIALASLGILSVSVVIWLNWPVPIERTNPPITPERTSTSPIFIDGTNWTSPHISGSGTELDPYIIKSLAIDGTASNYCIWIRNSRAVFRVVNCALENASYGLILQNSSNGYITNNTCKFNANSGICLQDIEGGLFSPPSNTVANNNCNENSFGISLLNAGSNVITNNTCQKNSNSGILLTYSGSISNTITNNTCNSNIYGICLDCTGSISNRITNNTCTTNTNAGIFLTSADATIVTKNICHNNTWHGIYLSGADCNSLKNNTCNNNYNGISLQESSELNNVTYNICNSNEHDGIFLASTTICNKIANNIVQGNVSEPINDEGTNNIVETNYT